MRRLLLLPVCLAIALTMACGGLHVDNSCPEISPDDIPVEVQLPPPVATGDVSQVVYDASRIINLHYVKEVSHITLLEAAWYATSFQLKEAGLSLPADADPQRMTAPNNRTREAQLRTAFEKAAALAESRIDSQDLVDVALNAMASSLNDNHTYFLPREAWTDEIDGSITSLGFRTLRYDSGFLVREVLPRSPADEAGLQPGDVITAINGVPVGENAPRIGGTTQLSVVRGTEPRTLSLQLRRVPAPVQTHRLLDGNVGLIRLFEFARPKDCDFMTPFQSGIDAAINDLKRQGATSWILDLRGNPGGSILAATFMASTFGYEGLVADIRDRNGSLIPHETTAASLLGNQPLAVLIDGFSGSSSEIVSYVLQHSGRARIIGEKSAGEVAAAVPYPIAGGAITVTVGLVEVGPKHDSLLGVGVTPDTIVPLDHSLLASEQRDSQIEAAVSYLRNRAR